MAETYCGKSCGSCVHKEKLNCPGCKTGPGARIVGDCSLAKCCVSKGHTACESCNIKPRCGMFHGREQAPVHRAKAMETEVKRLEEIRTRTEGLSKIYFLLFWLFVPGNIGSLLTQDFLADSVPVLGTVGMIICLLSSLAYGVILLSQYKRERGYLIAGALTAAAAVLHFVSDINAPADGSYNFATVIGLAAGIVQLVALKKEYTAHAEVLTGVDEIADKWLVLWRWTIGVYCAVLGSIIVAIIAPLLGMLVALAGGIGMIVVDIVRLVYLYRSAQACEEW